MIIHASSGLRPSSTTQSSKAQRKGEANETAKEVEDVVKLRYSDVELLISKDEQGRTRFAVQATFKYFKGGNRRPQRFVGLYHYEYCYKVTKTKIERLSPGATGPTS